MIDEIALFATALHDIETYATFKNESNPSCYGKEFDLNTVECSICGIMRTCSVQSFKRVLIDMEAETAINQIYLDEIDPENVVDKLFGHLITSPYNTVLYEDLRTTAEVLARTSDAVIVDGIIKAFFDAYEERVTINCEGNVYSITAI